MPLPLKRLRHHLIGILEKTAEHNEIYDAQFYNKHRDIFMANSSGAIAESIIDAFNPKSIVDVGCGTGLLLLALKERGIPCEGLEYSKAAIDICQMYGLKVTRFDIEHNTVPPNLRADVAISTEVAEHIPEACADHFVDILCTIAGTVIMTAAEPTPTGFGTNHVNEQPKEYWIRKFQARGYAYNERISHQWRIEWPEKKVEAFYASTVMVFERT
jgi:SAM-dependent methyltransferase